MFLENLCDADTPLARERVCVMTNKAGDRVQSKSGTAKQLKTILVHECNDLSVIDLGPEKVRPILLVSVPVQTYELKHKRIFFMSLQLFQGSQCLWGT